MAPGSAMAAVHGAGHHQTFDLQAHPGGLGLRVESTLASFGHGLQVGVSTPELDVEITEDGKAVVTHDRKVDANKCQDTGPVVPGDPGYLYVGKFVKTFDGVDGMITDYRDRPCTVLAGRVFRLPRPYHLHDRTHGSRTGPHLHARHVAHR